MLAAVALGSGVSGQTPKHTFALGKDDFLLDGAPFQMIGCEMHPARIPAEYRAHRIRMAKAMGCNTIGAYLFWNYHETAEGVFDFTTGNRDVARFVRLAQAEGLWVLLRPGPYVCAEWDFGGIPVYLLRYPDLKVRCMNPQYMQAAERYIRRLAAVVKPLLVASGGPIVMVQIENEYGSYGNDRAYMDRLKEVWVQAGIAGPFYIPPMARPPTCWKPGTWPVRPSASTRARRNGTGHWRGPSFPASRCFRQRPIRDG